MDKEIRRLMKQKVKRYLAKNVIGKNVAYYRELRGYNQTQLKTAIQYQSRAHISMVENGRLFPSPGMMLLLSEALQTRPALFWLERNNVIDAFVFAMNNLENGRQKTVVLETMQKVLFDNNIVHGTRGNRVEW